MLSVTVVNTTRTEVENPLSFVFEMELVCYFYSVSFFLWNFVCHFKGLLCPLYFKIAIMLYSVSFKDIVCNFSPRIEFLLPL